MSEKERGKETQSEIASEKEGKITAEAGGEMEKAIRVEVAALVECLGFVGYGIGFRIADFGVKG